LDMRRPSSCCLVVRGALKSRPGPEIDFHDVDVALQPVRDSVLWDV
jgi:hypothetical protein